MINTFQQTLKQKITFNGFGIHTAKFAEVTLVPAAVDQGIIFRSSEYIVKYIPENVRGDARGTQVILNPDTGQTIMTVEHLVSALAGAGVDNVLIEVEGPEIPIKDGSVNYFIEQIKKAGLEKQNKEKRFYKLHQKEVLVEKDKAILAIPAETFQVNFLIDYPDDLVRTDAFCFDLNRQDYSTELGLARTYGFEQEVDALLKNGLALGATLDNALLVSEKGYSKKLNYPDELVRHKVVDFIGDIAALGALPLAEFFVVKSGHAFNQRFVRQLNQK